MGVRRGWGGCALPEPPPTPGWPRAAPAPSFWICWRQAGCVARSCLLSVPVLCPRVWGSQRAPRARAPAPSPPRGAAARQSPPLTPLPPTFLLSSSSLAQRGQCVVGAELGRAVPGRFFFLKIEDFFPFFLPIWHRKQHPWHSFPLALPWQPPAAESWGGDGPRGMGQQGRCLGWGAGTPSKGLRFARGPHPARPGWGLWLCSPPGGWGGKEVWFSSPWRGDVWGFLEQNAEESGRVLSWGADFPVICGFN